MRYQRYLREIHVNQKTTCTQDTVGLLEFSLKAQQTWSHLKNRSGLHEGITGCVAAMPITSPAATTVQGELHY